MTNDDELSRRKLLQQFHTNNTNCNTVWGAFLHAVFAPALGLAWLGLAWLGCDLPYVAAAQGTIL